MYTLKENLVEELALVENYIAFLDRRRTGGILYIPEELAWGWEEPVEDVIWDAMLESYRETGSAASVLPIIFRGPAENSDKIRHIDMDNEFYSGLCARAYKLKAKIKELDEEQN